MYPHQTHYSFKNLPTTDVDPGIFREGGVEGGGEGLKGVGGVEGEGRGGGGGEGSEGGGEGEVQTLFLEERQQCLIIPHSQVPCF